MKISNRILKYIITFRRIDDQFSLLRTSLRDYKKFFFFKKKLRISKRFRKYHLTCYRRRPNRFAHRRFAFVSMMLSPILAIYSNTIDNSNWIELRSDSHYRFRCHPITQLNNSKFKIKSIDNKLEEEKTCRIAGANDFSLIFQIKHLEKW